MPSLIDPTKPETGLALTADVRTNFATAKTEIEALQAGVDTIVSNGISLQFASIAELQNYEGVGLLASMPSGRTADLSGYYQAGDGGGGRFWWDDSSSATPDGGTVFQPSGGGVGRWRRVIEGDEPYNVLWFGARGDNGVTDDIDAIMATIDAALPLGKFVRLPKRSYGVSSPVYLNGSHWATAVIDGGLGKPVAGEQPFVRSFMGDAFANFCARIVALPGFIGEAVVFGRNTALRTVKNLHVDAANIADVAIDISWIGSASGVPGTAAPACFNEFSGLLGQNALEKGIVVDGAADSLIQNINYSGGNAPIGFSMQLSGGGIWANNIHIHQGRALISAQNARISDSVLLNGVRIVSSSTDLLEFTSCQFSTDSDPDDINNGYTIYSATDVGSFGTLAINFTSCFFLGADALAPVPHKAYFAGRWNTGCTFTACHFNKENYFDAANWTVNGSGGTAPPVFDFDHCTFFASDGVSPVIPATVPTKVRVGLYACLRGDGLMLARRDFPDDVRLLTSSATEGRIRLKDSFLWADAAGTLRATKGTTPTLDTDGNILVQRQVGTASPQGSVTPTHLGAIFADSTNTRLYFAYNTANTSWAEHVRLRSGSATPIGSVTPTRVGEVFVDTTNDKVYIAKDITNADWIDLSVTFGTMASQNANSVAITGGSITGITDLAIADGGTGQSTAYAAKDALTIKGADMASASTVDLATATGDYVEITGTTTITALGTMAAGVRKTLRFQSALAITHNATSLIIPGNQNITVSAGNAIEVLSLGSGNWMVLGFSSFGANATFLVAGTVADARLPTTMAGKTLTTSVIVASVNAQVGTTYTLVLGDASKVVEMNNASANTLTVPTNATAAFAVGTVIDVVQTGAGKTTVAAAGGVTINSTGGLLSIAAQWSRATLRKTATDTWILAGSLIA